MKRILFFSHAPRLEGAEKSLLELVEYLKVKKDIEPMVILPREGRFSKVLKTKNISFTIAPRMAWWLDSTKPRRIILGPLKLAWNLLSWLAIRREMMSFQPDLVYINTLAVPMGMVAARDFAIPLIWHAREFIPGWTGKDYDFGRKWSLKRVAKSDAVIGNSIAVVNDLSGDIAEEKLHVVYNGIDVNKFGFKKHIVTQKNLLSGNPIQLLILGSINENKSQATAIECLLQLQKKGVKAELTMAGEEKGEYGIYLRKLAKSLNVINQIKFVGWQEDIEPLFTKTDITLICSNSEAFGRTIIESMAFGIPVICSDTGGAPEIIKLVASNLLFEARDVDDLTEKIMHLAQNMTIYRELSSKGRKIVEDNFDISIYGEKIYNIIQSTTAGTQNAP